MSVFLSFFLNQQVVSHDIVTAVVNFHFLIFSGIKMKAKVLWLALAFLSCCLIVTHGYEDITTLEDDDFAEFEQFDGDDDQAEVAGEILLFSYSMLKLSRN